MDSQICSYCQRPYGTISIDFKPIFQTIDHLTPENTSRKSGDRKGYRTVKLKNLTNLLLCCNECNGLKQRKTVIEFKQRLPFLLENKIIIKNASYLTEDLVKTIIKSIDILLYTRVEEESIFVGNIQLKNF